MTVALPTEVWQSADNMVTLNGVPRYDNAVKFATVVCPDGDLVVSFTGLAELPDGTRIADWIGQVLRGDNRPFGEQLETLKRASTRDISNSTFGGERLLIRVIAFSEERIVLYTIANLGEEGQWSKPPRKEFWMSEILVEGAMLLADGSGAAYISSEDRDLVLRLLMLSARDPQDMSGLLAAINRRVAEMTNTVGNSCLTFHKSSNESKGFQGHDHPSAPRGVPSRLKPDLPSIPIVLFGIDLTAVQEANAEALRAIKRGEPLTAEVRNRNLQTALNDALTPRGDARPEDPPS
jgi:hypothetical protein